MDPLKGISNEVDQLQSGIAALDDALMEIDRELSPCRDRSATMVFEVLRALNGVLQSTPEHKRDLHKIGFAIDEIKAKIREMMTRSKGVGVKDPLSAQRRTLAGLRHICQDLKSDLECIESFQANFQGRLTRLKG